jgi:class 3 adenylate cyclase/DNA-binding NarL/FixJ family response regulator
VSGARITVLLADDSVIVREGVKAMLAREPDIEVVGEAGDYDEVIARARDLAPDVLVTDIRMPPALQREGIDAAREVRKDRPGTGVVILSQYVEPAYAISVIGEDSSGWGYVLKDRVADGDQLAMAVRSVATGGSMLDPAIVAALEEPIARDDSGLDEAERELLHLVAQGRPIKAIAAAQGTTPAAVASAVEALFLKIAKGASHGAEESLRLLRTLHQAIIEREEQGESLSRFLPGGVADRLREEGRLIGKPETLEVTVLMSDVRGYCEIAERAEPAQLAGQLNEHRAEMTDAVLAQGGTVMQFAGDAVLAVFGAPEPRAGHAALALGSARGMHERQAVLNASWREHGIPEFALGIGLSTGTVAAALLGSEERVEYSIVGDTVNLAHRLQAKAERGQIVASEATVRQLGSVAATRLEADVVKGRRAPVPAYRIEADA